MRAINRVNDDILLEEPFGARLFNATNLSVKKKGLLRYTLYSSELVNINAFTRIYITGTRAIHMHDCFITRYSKMLYGQQFCVYMYRLEMRNRILRIPFDRYGETGLNNDSGY